MFNAISNYLNRLSLHSKDVSMGRFAPSKDLQTSMVASLEIMYLWGRLWKFKKM